MIVYLAHKMGENPESNAKRVKEIIKYYMVKYPNVTFIAPYLTSFEILDDSNPTERKKGLDDSIKVLRKCDALWICSELSEGIKQEIEQASILRIAIKFKDMELKYAGL